ncbi:hypothetical protein FCV25MIE_01961 [Fagus crenata]
MSIQTWVGPFLLCGVEVWHPNAEGGLQPSDHALIVIEIDLPPNPEATQTHPTTNTTTLHHQTTITNPPHQEIQTHDHKMGPPQSHPIRTLLAPHFPNRPNLPLETNRPSLVHGRRSLPPRLPQPPPKRRRLLLPPPHHHLRDQRQVSPA